MLIILLLFGLSAYTGLTSARGLLKMEELCKTLLLPQVTPRVSSIRIVYMHIYEYPAAGGLLKTCQVDSNVVWLAPAENHKT